MGYLCRLLRQFRGAWWLWLVTLGLACRRGPRGLLMKVAGKEKYALGSLGEGHKLLIIFYYSTRYLGKKKLPQILPG